MIDNSPPSKTTATNRLPKRFGYRRYGREREIVFSSDGGISIGAKGEYMEVEVGRLD